MENAKQTNFGTAIETASQAFGASFVAKVLGLIKADWKTERAFFDAMIEAQPLAVAVGYSILRAYNLSPNRWTLADLTEAAESLFDFERHLDALQDSDFEQSNAKKGL